MRGKQSRGGQNEWAARKGASGTDVPTQPNISAGKVLRHITAHLLAMGVPPTTLGSGSGVGRVAEASAMAACRWATQA